jgi:hypothetical protein
MTRPPLVPLLVTGLLAGLMGFVMSYRVGDFSSEPTYCEAPVNVVRESYLLEESTKWQKSYQEMENQWAQCTRDLIRVSEECNIDIICSDGTCE